MKMMISYLLLVLRTYNHCVPLSIYIDTILFVRGKPLDMSIIDMAKDLQINLFQTDVTMFEACGKLYEAGMHHNQKNISG